MGLIEYKDYINIRTKQFYTIQDAQTHINNIRARLSQMTLTQEPLIDDNLGNLPYNLEGPLKDPRLKTRFAYYENALLACRSCIATIINWKREITQIINELKIQIYSQESKTNLSNQINEQYKTQKQKEYWLYSTNTALYTIYNLYSNFITELNLEYDKYIMAKELFSRALTAAELDVRSQGLI